MELRAQLIGGSNTPKLSKIVSWKYAHLSAGLVSEDMGLNHGRSISCKLIQSISHHVSEIAIDHEFEWHYELPYFNSVVTHIGIGRDGTTSAIRGDGYRETMCGTLSFYNSQGERLHTTYTACAPEYGKKTFDTVLDMEIAQAKQHFPLAVYVGVADGAKDNWTYLQPHTNENVLDYFHATEYLSNVSIVLKKGKLKQKEWFEGACHDLKHDKKGAKHLLRELVDFRDSLSKQDKEIPETLNRTVTYFENNLGRMQYATYIKKGYPIGSGVTEAACKVVVKQRLNQSGMKWNIDTAQQMLVLRGLVCTTGRWEQFWNHFDAA
jgi:hypothetical protein